MGLEGNKACDHPLLYWPWGHCVSSFMSGIQMLSACFVDINISVDCSTSFWELKGKIVELFDNKDFGNRELPVRISILLTK